MTENDLPLDPSEQPDCWGIRYIDPTDGKVMWDHSWTNRDIANGRINDLVQNCIDSGLDVPAFELLPLRVIPPVRLDPAGEPKLEPTFLERNMAIALNMVKAWRDSDPGTPFPDDTRLMIEALLATYELRRKQN